MGIIGILLLVVFVIVCILIVSLVLIQNQDGDSLGGLFAGGSNSAFGSRSASVLTKFTYIVVILFFVTAFFLALINKTPSDTGVAEEALRQQGETSTEWWNNDQAATTTPAATTDTVPATDTAPAADTATTTQNAPLPAAQ
jgi:preprotein translocase subunit SecG